MSKSTKKVSVNLATINAPTMDKFSSYHIATLELRSLADVFKSKKAEIIKKRDEMLENRKKALENGESIDTVAVQFDIVPIDNELRALENKYKEDCKPHKETQKECLKMLPDMVYYAYLLTSKKGDINAKGSITIKKGKKEETYKIEKSLKAYVKDFLTTIGAGNVDTESAVDKFAQYISVNVSGMVVANKGEDYAKEKKETQFGKLFMAVFFQYAIVEKKIMVVGEDGSLAMRDFSQNA